MFGQPFDEDRYWKAVENASLLTDLETLPDGDLVRQQFVSKNDDSRADANDFRPRRVFFVPLQSGCSDFVLDW